MEEQTSKDEATRQRIRIIAHMNHDHHDSIVRYLQHYCNLSAWAAGSGILADITVNEMVCHAGGKTYRIQFEPPMSSLRETRERVVEMDKESVLALGRSDITIKEFVPPKGIYLPNAILILATFLAYSQRFWFERGGVVERAFGPGVARFSWVIQPWLIGFMLSIHSAEVMYFIPKHLSRHSVNIRSLVWWKWVAAIFIEGQFAMHRWRDLVRRRREQKQKQKH